VLKFQISKFKPKIPCPEASKKNIKSVFAINAKFFRFEVFRPYL
jgi:hypothetical protein